MYSFVFGDGVPAVSEPGRIAADAFRAFHDVRSAGDDRVAKLTTAVVAVDAGAELVTRPQVHVRARGGLRFQEH